jgi:hypothetical protein
MYIISSTDVPRNSGNSRVTAAEDGEAGERWQAVDVFVRLLS